jgi:hypothetical protein
MMSKTQSHSIPLQALLLSLLLLCSGNIHAQWVEATGTAEVRHGNKAEAKNQAVQNAVKDALMFAGASVTSVQKVTDGLLTQDDFMVSSHGSIQQLELVDEIHQQGMISVTIRADIIAEEKQCFSSDFLKSVAITQFRLVNREQAKIGGLYNIGKLFSKRLYRQMHEEGMSLLPRPWYQQKINSQSSFDQYYDDEFKVVDTIGQSSESQFVLVGQITDLSFGDQVGSDYTFWANKATERYFAADMMLYNTSTKEQIYREQFETVGDWNLDTRRMADINGRKFWQSNYGAAVDRLIDKVKTSIEDVLHCQPLQGKIVRVQNNQIQFNLGTDHGVSKGQLFSIIHQSHFVNQNGKHLPRFVISPYQVKVVDVYTKTAVANSVNDELLGNIQTTDHVILKEIPELGFE